MTGLLGVLTPLFVEGLTLLAVGLIVVCSTLVAARASAARTALAAGAFLVPALGWTIVYAFLVYPSQASCAGLDDCLPSTPLISMPQLWLGLGVTALGIALTLTALVLRQSGRGKPSPAA